MRALHDEVGDANVYMRGVLDQSTPEGRAQIVENLAMVLGERGHLFANEPSEETKKVFESLVHGPDGPPATLRSVFTHGIAPGEMADDDLPGLLTRYGLPPAATGRLPLASIEFRADGSRIEIPTNWVVAGPVR